MRKNDDFSSRRGGNKNDYVGLLELRYSRFKEYEKVGGYLTAMSIMNVFEGISLIRHRE